MTDIIEGELVGNELAEYIPPPTPATLFGTNDPAAVLNGARAVAKELADAVRKQHLFVKIGRGEHVKVEGWTLLGSMLGVFPVTVWSRKLENGWEAKVEARTRDGSLVGSAESMCDRSESRWASADEYAVRSMAQTRATSKALRQPLGFVMQLAGYDPTPAEEMPRDANRDPIDFTVAEREGELLGLAAQLDVRETVEKAMGEHQSLSGYGEWLSTQIKNAKTAIATREAEAAA